MWFLQWWVENLRIYPFIFHLRQFHFKLIHLLLPLKSFCYIVYIFFIAIVTMSLFAVFTILCLKCSIRISNIRLKLLMFIKFVMFLQLSQYWYSNLDEQEKERRETPTVLNTRFEQCSANQSNKRWQDHAEAHWISQCGTPETKWSYSGMKEAFSLAPLHFSFYTTRLNWKSPTIAQSFFYIICASTGQIMTVKQDLARKISCLWKDFTYLHFVLYDWLI